MKCAEMSSLLRSFCAINTFCLMEGDTQLNDISEDELKAYSGA